MTEKRSMSRRNLLRGGAVAGGGLILAGGTTALAGPLLRKDRPVLTHGISSGDITGGGGVIWARADRVSRMWVEVATRPDFADSRTVRGPQLGPDTDFCGKLRLDDLPVGKTIHYRVTAEGEETAEPLTGSLRTTPGEGRDVRFVWSADVAGQGWGINEEFGGYTVFKDLADADPDFFLCSGDFYYGDNPLEPTVTLPDGRLWRNLMTPEKEKVAETLDEFRGQYKYNLLDGNLRDFLAKVPMTNAWDDHEVVNNWFPGEILDDDAYTEKRVDVLAGHARRAFTEYTPNSLPMDGTGRIYRKISHGPLLDVFVLDMRTYKDANTLNDSPDGGVVLGAEQLAWLKRELSDSKATWKVIANDLPLANIVGDGPENVEAVAQRDNGVPLGREVEIAEVLSHIHHAAITGTVWLTADVHYTAAHHYDPSRAAFTDFTPFWEFVTGPLNAGSFGPGKLDTTFGAKAEFVKAPDADHQGVGPLDGYQFYGEVSIDAESQAMTVKLMEVGGIELYRKELAPA